MDEEREYKPIRLWQGSEAKTVIGLLSGALGLAVSIASYKIARGVSDRIYKDVEFLMNEVYDCTAKPDPNFRDIDEEA